MVLFLKVNIDGIIVEDKIENINDLYKKCGFRKNTDFKNIFTNNLIEIWGKTKYKKDKLNSNTNINKLTNTNIYGICAIIKRENDTILDLNLEMWNLFIKSIIENDNIENDNSISDIELEINSISDDDNSINNNEDSENSELKEEKYLYIYSSEEEK